MMIENYWEKFGDKFDNFVEKIGCLRSCLQKTRLRDNREKFSKQRVIYLNNKKTASYDGEKPLKYKCNKIKTSKYTKYNFLPKNLFEQFRRIANIYFLIFIIILFVIPDAPNDPTFNIINLVAILLVTAIRQGHEDTVRHRADTEFNSKQIRVVRDGSFVSIKSEDIRCGDIVEVLVDQTVPCDLLLLYSNHNNKTCQIKTSNLDGDTDLKARTVPPSFPKFNSENELLDISGVITCQKPNQHLYEFNGKLIYEGNEYSISNENMLLRGTHLKSASTIYGCAVYTGSDTKMMLNSRYRSNKLSWLERSLNFYVVLIIIIEIVLSILCVVGTIAYEYIYSSHWYLWRIEPVDFFSDKPTYYFDMFVYFVNLNNFVPPSLWVILELVRFFGAFFFELDLEMYDEKKDQRAKVYSSDVNEDLGQIEYLFSDKTGTLTENEMIFKKFSINGRVFSHQEGEIHEDGSDSSGNHVKQDFYDDKMKRFLEALSVCHTVRINTADEKYNASSPDELSFIEFCQKVGIEYKGDEIVQNTTNSTLVRKVTYNNKYEKKDKTYEVLHTLEFDSDRKRMSVIVRDRQRNEYVLFCKGADSSMIKRCSGGDERIYETPMRTFAENGWRVIVLAYRVLSESEYRQFDAMLAQNHTGSALFDKIESGLHIVGVTAVEDKLQEDVEITLSELRQAGIKIWVLTGDKLETSVNISDSCRHFSPDMIRFIVKDMKDVGEIDLHFSDIKESMLKNVDSSFALVINGETLSNLVETNQIETFKEIALKCDSVLCCRMSPIQKAYIVKMVKNSKGKPMTAAIGDGANDISMLQEAHVGFGLFGKEGRMAVASSDFSFTKFKCLKRAFLVHGYFYYTRTAIFAFYFFYQNMVLSICPIYFAFFSVFSANSFLPDLFVTLYNIIMTSNSPVIFALFEQHIPINKIETNPFYYRTIARNRLLSIYHFIKWVCIGFYHSVCAFFLPIGFFYINEVFTSDGKVLDFMAMNELIFFLVFLFVHFKVSIIWNCWNNQVPMALLCDLVGYLVVCIGLSSFIIPDFLTIFTNQQSIYFVIFNLFGSGSVWFFIVFATVIAIAPDLVIDIAERYVEDTMLSRAMIDFRQKAASRGNLPMTSPIELESPSNQNLVNSTFRRMFTPHIRPASKVGPHKEKSVISAV